MTSIAIIGTGRLGTQIAEELIRGNEIRALYLWNRSFAKLEGTILSLRVWVSLIGSDVQIEALNFDRLDDIDLVIIAVKERYDARELMVHGSLPAWLPRDLRYVGLLQDLPTIVEVSARLRSYRGPILVLTNPVDVVTTLVSAWVQHAAIVGGGLSVDSARLRFAIRIRTGRNIASVPVAGEHGSFFPVSSMSEELSTLMPAELDAAVNEARALGIEIFRDLGYTLHDCAFAFTADALWLSGARDVRLAFLSIPRQGVFVGQPCWNTPSGIRPVTLSSRENEQLDTQAIHIRNVADHARMEGARLRRYR